MSKLLIVSVLIMSILLVGSVSAMSVNYYFHPQCGHCQSLEPFIEHLVNKYDNIFWNMLDTSKGSYDITGTPTMVITTDDNRIVTLVGSGEIPRYADCEANEQSNLNCPTLSASECTDGSWFTR